MIPVAQTVDVSPRGADPWWELVAWLLLVLLLGSAITFLAILKYRVYDDEQRRQLSAIRASEIRASPPTIPVVRGFDRSTLEEDLRKYWIRDDPPRVYSVRSAIRELRAGVAATIPSAPPLIRNGVIEGAAIAAVGMLVYLPAAGIRDSLDLATIGTVLNTILRHVTGVDHLETPLQDGPIGAILEFVAAVAILSGRAVWNAWPLVAIALIVGGIVIYRYESTWNDRHTRLAAIGYGALLVTGGLILLAKVVIALLEGHFLEAMIALYPWGYLIGFGLAIVGTWLLARLFPEPFEELGAAIATIGRSFSLRTVLLSRSLPYAVVFLVAIVLLAWIRPSIRRSIAGSPSRCRRGPVLDTSSWCSPWLS